MGTLYIGVTNNLKRRIYEHKEGVVEGFTKKYGLKTLVYYEQHEDMKTAILREKRLKEWNRNYKLALIIEHNPQWRDLFNEL